jgi:hypothetical protein
MVTNAPSKIAQRRERLVEIQSGTRKLRGILNLPAQPLARLAEGWFLQYLGGKR